MQKRGHEFFITARRKDVTETLLESLDLPFVTISGIGKHKGALFTEYISRTTKLFRHIRKFKPQLLTGCMGVSIAPLGRLLRKPSLVFYNNESASLTNGVVYRACSRFVTPKAFRMDMGKKHQRYDAFQEQAYLHPSRFTPDPKYLSKLGLKAGDPFTILRFVSWGSSHDFGLKGLSNASKKKAIETFSQYGKVFISSEAALPDDLAAYRLPIKPDELHHILAFATLLFGESATLAAEAAMFGTHAIYVDAVGRGYTDILEEKYGLVSNFSESSEDQELAIDAGETILQDADATTKGMQKAQHMHSDTEDLIAFMVRHAEALGS